jgi:hypothetical protein
MQIVSREMIEIAKPEKKSKVKRQIVPNILIKSKKDRKLSTHIAGDQST